MKIIYVGLKYNYGKPNEGFAYEHVNFEAGLKQYCKSKNWDLCCFHPDEDPKEYFADLCCNSDFDVAINFEFNDSYEPDLGLWNILRKRGTITLNWSSDSSWRFYDFILPRKDKFDWFITTHSSAVSWYENHGMKVIRSQWAGIDTYNESLGHKYDVSFVGQKYNIRGDVVKRIQDTEIDLHLFGNYWDEYPNWHGYQVDHNIVNKVFNQSKINLNFSWPFHIGTLSQIKGRLFQLPAAKAFQITTPADDLERYFEPDKEIVVVNTTNDMIDKIRYYLEHDDERQQIAQASYDRFLCEHAWNNRFEEIFNAIH